MAAAHEVSQLALHLGARGSVVLAPGGVDLARPGAGERLFVRADADGAPTSGRGALWTQRAGGAGIPEVGHAAAFAVRTDHHGDAIRARDGARGHVDIEAVLGEEPTGGRRVLGLAPRLDAFFFESLLERTGQIGVVDRKIT